MIIQAIKYGEPPPQEFAFTYSGDFTDNRDENGIGTVTLNTSGTLTVTGSPVTVSATIVGGGGGAAASGMTAGGGGGGIQTVEVTLEPGIYEIVIGVGGAGFYSNIPSITTAGSGGDTTAFEYTSTGGKGGTSGFSSMQVVFGVGGTPNGNAGTANSGGAPNGGTPSLNSSAANNGGDGYVELTFS